jgi:hypothetical protein
MRNTIEASKSAIQDLIDNAVYISEELNNPTAAATLVSETRKAERS